MILYCNLKLLLNAIQEFQGDYPVLDYIVLMTIFPISPSFAFLFV